MKLFKNILIVRTDRIGDVVLTTPAIYALRNAYPSARISILVSQLTVDLVDGNPHIDEIIVDDREGLHKGLLGYINLVRKIKSKHFDLAVVYHTKKRTNLMCFLSGIPWRLGYKDKKFGYLLTMPVKDDRHLGIKHEAQYCLDLLDTLGIESKLVDPYLPIHERNEVWVAQLLKKYNINEENKIIAIHPGASDPSKCWPVERFLELMENLNLNEAVRFIIIGSRNIEKIAGQMSAQVKVPPINLVAKTSVGEMVSLLKRCDLLVSNDSGPVHIASALGTPVISIFTRNQPGINPERWKPLGKKSTFVAVEYDDTISFAKSGGIDRKYDNQITVTEVLNTIKSVLL